MRDETPRANTVLRLIDALAKNASHIDNQDVSKNCFDSQEESVSNPSSSALEAVHLSENS